MDKITRIAVAALALGALVPVSAAADAPLLPEGARYVAMGSSFASGSGVAPYDPAAPARCQRSTENYARQLARERKFILIDVTCGGATTDHITGRWDELPPQIEALTADTALVTITIGGNDIGYIGSLIASSCGDASAAGSTGQPLCRMIAASRHGGAAMPTAIEDGWRKVEAGLTGIIDEIRRRAPGARIIFVDYLTVLPDGALCDQTPLSTPEAERGRAVAARLARLTYDVAIRNRAEVLPMSELSRKARDACAPSPWISGFIPPADSRVFVPYHPNHAGMTAVAEALDRYLDQ